MPAVHQKLIEDVIPGQINVSGIQRVLQSLLAERVSIRDLPTILEAVAEAALQQARLRELQIKKWKRLWKLSEIERMNPDWEDLYPTLF